MAMDKLEKQYSDEIVDLMRQHQEAIKSNDHNSANLSEYILYKKQAAYHSYLVRKAFEQADSTAHNDNNKNRELFKKWAQEDTDKMLDPPRRSYRNSSGGSR